MRIFNYRKHSYACETKFEMFLVQERVYYTIERNSKEQEVEAIKY